MLFVSRTFFKISDKMTCLENKTKNRFSRILLRKGADINGFHVSKLWNPVLITISTLIRPWSDL